METFTTTAIENGHNLIRHSVQAIQLMISSLYHLQIIVYSSQSSWPHKTVTAFHKYRFQIEFIWPQQVFVHGRSNCLLKDSIISSYIWTYTLWGRVTHEIHECWSSTNNDDSTVYRWNLFDRFSKFRITED